MNRRKEMLTSEFSKPLSGTPYYRNVGLIKVYDRNNRRYSVGEIIYESFDDQNFQYIIKPYWNSVDALPRGLFHGIPGINMDLRRDAYYRVNMTPAFISMRTPSEGREDVRQLMESVGLDYYDRFEWLLRSEMKCGNDNLIVVRKPNGKRTIEDLDGLDKTGLTPDDVLKIESLSDFESSNTGLVRDMYSVLQSGVKIYIKSEHRYLTDRERKTMLYLLNNMMLSIDRNIANNRRQGRENAKASGKYAGRKPIAVDKTLLSQVANDFAQNVISEAEAMARLSIKSRSTFYRKLKLVK